MIQKRLNQKKLKKTNGENSSRMKINNNRCSNIDKVWIVEFSSDESHWIEGVFNSKLKAETFVKHQKDNDSMFIREFAVF